MRKRTPLFTGYEWDTELVDKLWDVIEQIGREELKLDYYEPQFEIITSDQMIDAYTSHGMPIYYNHWSFGKAFAKYKKQYEKGDMGLAYEMVINSDPCIAYLMEDNTATMTALVIAHASVGHSHFFKNNYLFKQHTQPGTLLNYLEYAKNYIKMCEDKYGTNRVTFILDTAHVLQEFSVNRYKKCDPDSKEKQDRRVEARIKNFDETYNEIWNTLPEKQNSYIELFKDTIIKWKEGDVSKIQLREENLLLVVENYSLVLKDWERGILRIVRNMAQYFYPQYHTKVMNEGFASFTHYHIMKSMYEKGHIDEGSYLEFLKNHVAVCNQPEHTQLNPYKLGFEIFMDIKRACISPDEEDYKWLPDVAGQSNWQEEIKRVVKYYKDESFILQYLSPKVIRRLGLFSYSNNPQDDYYEITGIQNDADILKIKKSLSKSYELDNYRPYFEVVEIDRIDNYMNIVYNVYNDRQIDDYDYMLLQDAMESLTGYRCEFTEE